MVEMDIRFILNSRHFVISKHDVYYHVVNLLPVAGALFQDSVHLTESVAINFIIKICIELSSSVGQFTCVCFVVNSTNIILIQY